MGGGRKVAMALLTIVGLYVVSPCWALWRLGADARRGDVSALGSMIDWPKIRAGLRRDVDDALTGRPSVQVVSDSDRLPAFGSGMMTRIADRVVDRAITPKGLLDLLRRSHGANHPVRLDWVWPTGLTSFEAAISVDRDSAIRLRMHFAQGRWRLTRIWLPSAMMQESSAAHT